MKKIIGCLVIIPIALTVALASQDGQDPSASGTPAQVIAGARAKAGRQSTPAAVAANAPRQKEQTSAGLEVLALTRACLEKSAVCELKLQPADRAALPAAIDKRLGTTSGAAYDVTYQGRRLIVAVRSTDQQRDYLAFDASGTLLAGSESSTSSGQIAASSSKLVPVGWHHDRVCCQAGPLTCNASGRQIWCYGFGRSCNCSYETVNGIVSCMDEDGFVRGDRCP